MGSRFTDQSEVLYGSRCTHKTLSQPVPVTGPTPDKPVVEPQPQPAPITDQATKFKGVKVTRVTWGGGASFINAGPKVWYELRSDGTRAFTFRESNRDEWSVYLVDDSREVNIQIDLYKKEIIYSDASGKRFVLAKVEGAF